jgi:hypothetical protein
MDDDTGFLIFLAVAVLVIAGIVTFGVLSSRRKKRATEPTFTVRLASIGDQPFLESSDIDPSDVRQEELFRLAYPLGGAVSVPFENADGEPAEREMHISRVGRSLRAGFPQAKIGLSVYFREWEGSEFPVAFPVKGGGTVATIALDATGARALDAAGTETWSAPWTGLLFSNGPDLLLSDGASAPLRFDRPGEHPELEEILIKYGTLKQMHF